MLNGGSVSVTLPLVLLLDLFGGGRPALVVKAESCDPKA